MTEHTPQENQQELFGSFSADSPRPERIASIAKTHKPILITTTIEQILLVTIVSILGLCFIFFLGVLRGKSLSSEEGASWSQPVVKPKPKLVATPVLAASAVKPAPAINKAKPPIPAVSTTPSAPAAVSKSVNSSPAAAKNANKPYTIQLVTTKKKAYADSEVDVLRKAGYYTMIIPSGEYYQVCVGFYANKAEAKKDLAFFNGKYRGCYLRRR